VDKENGSTVYSHTGSLPGYLGYIAIHPERRLTIIYLANYYTYMSEIDKALTAIALGKPYDPPFSGEVKELEANELEALLGNYRLQDGDVITVSKGKAVPLAVTNPNKYRFGLIALARDRFYMPANDGVVTFQEFVEGTPRKINLHYDGTDHPGTRQ
jgi:hypothetical protein